MDYFLISETTPRARKEYKCIWCNGLVNKGEKHIHEISKFNGNLQDFRWHLECKLAAHQYFRLSGEDEFSPGEYKRGTIEGK